jgi:hypothetical protein
MELPVLLVRIRRNHAIEHAALHLLGRSPHPPRLAARSDWRGLTFYGDVDLAVLRRAVNGALFELSTGQRRLAVHPRCGSMVSVSLLLSLLSLRLVRSGLRPGYSAARNILTLAGLGSAALIARPLGEALQAHVLTDSDPGGARLVSIHSSRLGTLAIHRVTLAHT